ncbi:Uncharacterised protein [Vibrio cholerae]|nr:Uncharacterised protein [Vibrio cholerae]
MRCISIKAAITITIIPRDWMPHVLSVYTNLVRTPSHRARLN